MQIVPIEPVDQSGSLIQCCKCSRWWKMNQSFADLDGAPFKDYYCWDCARDIGAAVNWDARMPANHYPAIGFPGS